MHVGRGGGGPRIPGPAGEKQKEEGKRNGWEQQYYMQKGPTTDLTFITACFQEALLNLDQRCLGTGFEKNAAAE